MKRIIFLLLAIVLQCCTLSAQTFQWATHEGNSTGDIEVNDMDVDGSGNVYTCGRFKGNVDFGGTAFNSNNGEYDSYVAKFDATGAFIWVQTIGGSSNWDRAHSLVIDSQGNVYIGGSWTDDLVVGPNTYTANYPDVEHLFLAKFDLNGNFSWSKRSDSYLTAAGIGLNPSGNLLVAGHSAYTNDILEGDTIGAGAVGLDDFYQFELNVNGDMVSSGKFGSGATMVAFRAQYTNNPQYSFQFDTDMNMSGSNIYATGGYLDEDVAVNSGRFGTTSNDIFQSEWGTVITRNDSRDSVTIFGNFVNQNITGTWLKIMDSQMDSKGNTYMVGEFTNAVSYRSLTIPDNSNGNNFVLKINSSGKPNYLKAFNGGEPTNLTLVNEEEIIVAGNHTTTLNLDGNVLPGNSNNGTDAYIAKIGRDTTIDIVSVVFEDSLAFYECGGDSIIVSYETNGVFNPGNMFIVQLANDNGFFAAPTNIDTFYTVGAGTISTFLPDDIVSGNDYRLRIISTNPVINVGADNGYDLQFRPKPTLTTSGDVTLCGGNSTTLDAYGLGATVTWSPASFLSNTNLATTICQPDSTITYTVSGSDNWACYVETELTVTVGEPLSITVSADTSVCIGQSVNLSAAGASNLTWSPSTSLNTGAGANVIATPSVATQYTVTGDDGGATCPGQAQVTVLAHAIPAVNAFVGNGTICAGDSTNIQATGANTFLWTPSIGLANDYANNVAASPADTTTYTVVATSDKGCVNSDSVTINVKTKPSIIVSANDSICLGESSELIVSGADTYLWTPNQSLSSTTNDTVISTPTTSINYKVVGTTNGCSDQKNVLVHVATMTVADDYVDACGGGSTPLQAFGMDTYTWTPAAGLDVTTGDSVNATVSFNSYYQVLGIDNNGCRDSIEITVNIPFSTPTFEARKEVNGVNTWGGAVTYCKNAYDYETDEVYFIAENVTNVVWTPSAGLDTSGGNRVKVTLDTSITYMAVGYLASCGEYDTSYYTVTINPEYNLVISVTEDTLCGTGTTTLSGSSGWVVHFYPYEYVISSYSTSMIVAPDTTFTYYAWGQDGSCVDTAEVPMVIHVFDNPDINIGPNIDGCPGDSALVVATGGESYTWSGGNFNTTTGDSVYVYTDAAGFISATGTSVGCSATDYAYINLLSKKTVSAAVDSANICVGDSASFYISDNYSYNSYVWSLPNGVVADTTSNSSNVAPSFTTQYEVNTDDGCSFPAFVTVNVATHIGVIWAATDSTCSNNSAVSLSGGSPIGGVYSGAYVSAASFNPVLAGTGDHDIVYHYYNGGCIDSAIQTISVLDTPTVSIVNPADVCTGGIPVNLAGGTPNGGSFSGNFVAVGNFYPSTSGIGTHVINYTYDDGVCASTVPAEINVLNLPNVSYTEVTQVCLSDTNLVLSGGSPTGGSYDGPFTIGGQFSPDTAGVGFHDMIYTYNDGVCQNTAIATVEVVGVPILSYVLADTDICAGDSIFVSAYSTDSIITNCTESSTGSGTDQGNAFVAIEGFPCVGSGVVTSASLDATIGTNCGAWYYYSIFVDGTEIASQQCDQTGFDLTPYLPFDTVIIVAFDNPADNYSDNVSMTLDVHLQGEVSNVNVTWAAGINGEQFYAPNISTDYIYTATDLMGCSGSDTISIGVNANSGVIANLSKDSLCYGDSLFAFGSGSVSYQWIPNLNDSTYVSPVGSSWYTVTALDSNGCMASDSAYVEVLNPNVQATSTDSSVCIGGTFVLNGSGAINYSWDTGVNDGDTLTGFTTATYAVTGTDAFGCWNSSTVQVIVNALPVVSALSSEDSICSGEQLVIYGQGANSYSWSGGVVDSVWFTATSSQNLVVLGTDSNGCVGSDSLNYTVLSLPIIQANISADSICIGEAVLVYGSGGESYSWSGGNSDSVPFLPIISSAYTVTGSDVYGCENTDVTWINVFDINLQMTATDTAICLGDSVAIDALGGISYTWSSGLVSGINFAPLTSAFYHVSATDVIGCVDQDSIYIEVNLLPIVTAVQSADTLCEGDNITLSGSGASSYTWSNGIANNIAFQATTSNTYYMLGTDNNGCSSADSASIMVYGLPTISASASSDTICIGDSIVLTGSGGIAYFWSGSVIDGQSYVPSISESIVLVGLDINSCQATDSVYVAVFDPIVTAMTTTTGVCEGEAIILSAAGASQYTWSNGALDGVAYFPTNSAYFVVVGTDDANCSSIDSIFVEVFTLPTILAQSASSEVCEEDEITLFGAGGVSYTWNNGIIDGVTTTIQNTTTFVVTGTDANGCTGTDQTEVIVNALPTVTLSISDLAPCVNDEDVILAGFPSGGVYAGQDVQDSIFAPNSIGNVLVSYTYTDANGCTGVVEDNIEVGACLTINPHAKNQGFGLYPNPSNGLVNLLLDEVQQGTVDVFEAQGKRVYSSSGRFNKSSVIDLGALNSGVYVVRFTSNETMLMKQLIVSH